MVLLSEWWAWWVIAVDGGEPRGHDVIGVLDEVVADQCVEPLVIAGEMRRGECDHLPGSAGRRPLGGAAQQPTVTGAHRDGHEDVDVPARRRSGQGRVGRCVRQGEHLAQFVVDHPSSVTPVTDDGLTIG